LGSKPCRSPLALDDDIAGMQCSFPQQMTAVRMLDHSSHRINFEATIDCPEEIGVVQIEHIGVNISSTGCIAFGAKVEAINDRVATDISADLLARLIVDIEQDTSLIFDNLLLPYQQALLNTIFIGHADHRDKMTVIMCDHITPRMLAAMYLDSDEKENELKQLVGQTQSAHDLSTDEMLIIGANGVLLIGQGVKKHEPTMTIYLALRSLDFFARNFFNRLFLLSDQLQRTRKRLDAYFEDPNSIPIIRKEISDASRNVIQLEDATPQIEVPRAADEATAALQQKLDLLTLRDDLQERVSDLKKNVGGLSTELTSLAAMTDVITETQMFRLQESLQSNSRSLENVFRANERAGSSLEMMQGILAGSLAFDILDRMTGEWSVMELEWAKSTVGAVMEMPFLWFAINVIFWLLVGAWRAATAPPHSLRAVCAPAHAGSPSQSTACTRTSAGVSRKPRA